MQTLQNGIEVPTNSDTYKLTEDLAKMGDTANVIIPVADEAARNSIPDPYASMTVSRLDLPGAPLETHDGTKWPVSNSSWALLPMAQAFNHHNGGGWSRLKFAVRDGWVMVSGAVERATPWATGITCAIIPAILRPATKIQGTNNSYVGPEGNVSLAAGSVAVSFSLSWPIF